MRDKKPTSTCPNPYCEDGRVLSSATGLNNEYMGDCRHPVCPAVEPEHPVREEHDEDTSVEVSDSPYGKTTNPAGAEAFCNCRQKGGLHEVGPGCFAVKKADEDDAVVFDTEDAR